jgi:hypothetical protein
MDTDRDRNTGTDFEYLVSLAEKVRAQYLDRSQAEWAASPLNWIRQVPSSHSKGIIGERLVMEWARSSGLQVRPRHHRGHDCVIAGATVEVKLSLRWSSDVFVFQSIRDLTYDVAALLGIAPNEAYLWIVPKSVLWQHAKDQERGMGGRGSKWVRFSGDEPPEWLRRWGGSFAKARAVLEEAAMAR